MTDTTEQQAATSGEAEQKPGEGEQAEQPSFKAITSQEEFDEAIKGRITRERNKFADYDALKQKASKLDDIEQANKTELQREKEAREAAEKRAEQAEFTALRSEVARSKGVPSGSLTGTTKEELEASADELISWRDAQKPAATKKTATATSGGGLKSGASTNGGAALTLKQLAAERLRQMRSGN